MQELKYMQELKWNFRFLIILSLSQILQIFKSISYNWSNDMTKLLVKGEYLVIK